MLKRPRLILPALAMLAAALLPACATPAVPPAPPVDALVDMQDILASPFDYDGKTVTIKGWASLLNEDYGIWASQADYKERNWRNCISLLNTYADAWKNEALDLSNVLVTGVFSRDIFHNKDGQVVVRLGACNEAGIRFHGPDGLRSLPPSMRPPA